MRHLGEQARRAAPDCRRAIEDERPDAVIVDMRSFGGAFAAEASSLPWALYSVSVPEFSSRDAPPAGPGLKPRSDVIGRLRDRFVGSMRNLSTRGKAREYLEPLRSELGLPPRRGITEYVLAAQVAVFYTAEPFEYPRSDWPASVRLVGPGLWDPPAEPPQWLGEIERPIVLVTTSTDFQDDGKLVETALEALADEQVFVHRRRRRPGALHHTRQCSRRALRSPRRDSAALRLRGLARRARHQPEGDRRRGPGLRSPVRPRPAGDRSPGRGVRGGDSPSRLAPAAGPVASRRSRGDREA
jgi:hypothetical protein